MASTDSEEMEATVIRSEQHPAFHSLAAMMLWLGSTSLNVALGLALLLLCRSATSLLSPPLYPIGGPLILLWGSQLNSSKIQIPQNRSSPIPYRRPIDIIVGKPIEFKQNPNPSKEEVAEAHDQFLSSLERLFLKYRGSSK